MSTTQIGSWSLLGAIALAAACGGDLGAAGEGCSTSADCAAGLLCDTSLKQPVCAQMIAPHPDLARSDLAGGDLAGADLAGADLSANDLSAVLQDLSQLD